MIHFFLKDVINSSQHGHRPGRGSVTCWREILDNVENHKFIYEFDYKKFHDLIGRKYLMQALLNFRFPKEIAIELIHLCSPYVRGTDDEDPLRLEMVPGFDIYHYYRGVVQGSNIAAYLGLLVLEDLGVYDLLKGKYIGYADDGLLFSNDESVVEEWKSKLGGLSGVEPKPEKSGWVKHDGKWLKSLKFIGLELFNDGRTLRGATRSGKTGMMEWKNVETGEIWNFLSKYNGKLENSGGSVGVPVKPSAWDNRGYADLGFLSAMVFSDNMYNINVHKIDPIKAHPESVLMLCVPDREDDHKLAVASSACFRILSILLLDPELSRKKKRVSKVSKPLKEFRSDLGGFIQVTDGSPMEWTKEFQLYLWGDNPKDIWWQMNDPSLKNVKGYCPQGEVGFDLFPCESKRPSPYVVKEGKVIHLPDDRVTTELLNFVQSDVFRNRYNKENWVYHNHYLGTLT